MELPKTPKVFGYSIAANEPSVFTPDVMGVSHEWISWLVARTKTNNVTGPFPLVTPSEYAVSLGFTLAARLRQLIEVDDWDLAPEPPPMFLPFKPGYISQAWVIDTAKRDGMTPHEAVSLALMLKKQQEDYDNGR